jgi:hypothetical protein
MTILSRKTQQITETKLRTWKILLGIGNNNPQCCELNKSIHRKHFTIQLELQPESAIDTANHRL